MRFFDAHCDTLTKLFDSGEGLFSNSKHISLERLQASFKAPVQVFAIWTEPMYYRCALERALEVISYYYAQEKKNKKIFGHVNSLKDLRENERLGKISGILAMEGGEPLLGKKSLLDIFYRLGVRVCSLTWNYRNELAWGVNSSEPAGGLTAKGRALVSEMERIGIAIDVSHLSERGFWEIDQICEKPFIATHSNSKAIFPHPRNLTDSQINAIGSRGGVIGINLYPEFIGHKGSIAEVLRHIEHILDVGGEDVPGMGCDFDGVDTLPLGIENVSHIPRLFEVLERELGAEVAEKIAYGNLRRFFEKILV